MNRIAHGVFFFSHRRRSNDPFSITGNFILKFQPWLVKVNSKVFGPELGPVLEKLELAAVEQVRRRLQP